MVPVVLRCAACYRPRKSGQTCVCGASGLSREPPQVFATLEAHLGIDSLDEVRAAGQLTGTFGFSPPPAFPAGTRLVRQFRHWLEVEWSDVTEPDDLRWASVVILHCRGPSGPVPTRLRQLREVRDGTPALLGALLGAPPPELTTFELRAPAAVAELVARAPELPSLQYLVVHFTDGAPGLVLTDQLLERHAWLDCCAMEGQTVTFSLRRG